MDTEKPSAEQQQQPGVDENHVMAVSDGTESATAAPSLATEVERSSLDMPSGSHHKDAETSVSLAAAPSPGMPTAPNGGLAAWLQVLGGFFVYLNTWGLMITYGVFQTYYESHLVEDYSPSSISWIGTLQAFLLIEVGIFAGPLYDRGYLRHLLLAGSILVPLGLMMASLATEFYSILLSLGVCCGLGMGLLFFPAITAISTYWTTRRGMANGIAAGGSAIGAIIYPIVLRQLIAQVSFPWAVRTIGFLVFVTNLIPLIVMKPLFLPQGKRTIDKAIFKDRVYIFFSLANVIGWLGVQIPLFYAGSFGVATLHIHEPTAFYLLAILGAGSLPGRLLAPLLGDTHGPLNIYPLFMALAGVLALVWTRVASYAGLVVVALLYGFAYGGIVSLPPPAVAAMTRDMRQLGTRIGLAFSCAGISVLVGPPIAGAIERGAGGFTGLFVFAGTMLLVGSACLVGVAWLNRRERAKESVE